MDEMVLLKSNKGFHLESHYYQIFFFLNACLHKFMIENGDEKRGKSKNQ